MPVWMRSSVESGTFLGIISANASAVSSPTALPRSSSVRSRWFFCSALARAVPPFAVMLLFQRSSTPRGGLVVSTSAIAIAPSSPSPFELSHTVSHLLARLACTPLTMAVAPLAPSLFSFMYSFSSAVLLFSAVASAIAPTGPMPLLHRSSVFSLELEASAVASFSAPSSPIVRPKSRSSAQLPRTTFPPSRNTSGYRHRLS